MTPSIPNRPNSQQQRGQDKGVGIDDPCHPGLACLQISIDLRQRNIDDCHVEKDEEIPGAQAEDEQFGHAPTLSAPTHECRWSNKTHIRCPRNEISA